MAPTTAFSDTATTRRVALPWWTAGFGLVALVFLTYLPTLANGFIWDDNDYVEHNLTLRSLGGLWRIWSRTSATPQYYPLVHTSFCFEYHLWGLHPAGYHLDNLLLHAASVLLLWTLLKWLRVPAPWLIAAVWGVHPVNCESVAWITERKNVLSGVFYLSAFLLYLRSIDWTVAGIAGIADRRRYALAGLLFLLALLSKTVTATFPAAVLLVIVWKRGRLLRRDVLPLLPFFAVGAALASLTGYLERTQVGAHGPEWNFTLLDRLLIAGRAVCFYAEKLVMPVHLSFVYPRWHIDSADPLQLLAPAAVVLTIAALWMVRRRIGTAPLVGALFFVGTLSPALGFANVYPMRYSFVADHFQYLAGIGGIALIIGPLAAPLAVLLGGRVGQIVAALLIATLASLTFHRCFAYRDRLTLWETTVAATPASWMAHTNLGHALHDAGRDTEATVQYHQALQLAPGVPDTHLNVAIGDAVAGDYAGAITQCRSAIAIDPKFTPAFANLAKAALSEGDLPAASADAEAALQITPGFGLAENILGRVRQQRGDTPGAIAAYTAALTADADDADSHARLAECLAATGQLGPAEGEYERSLQLSPNNAPAWTTLGSIFLATHRPAQAANCFRTALQIDPHFAPAFNALRAFR